MKKLEGTPFKSLIEFEMSFYYTRLNYSKLENKPNDWLRTVLVSNDCIENFAQNRGR
jgi:hypothetical protein